MERGICLAEMVPDESVWIFPGSPEQACQCVVFQGGRGICLIYPGKDPGGLFYSAIFQHPVGTSEPGIQYSPFQIGRGLITEILQDTDGFLSPDISQTGYSGQDQLLIFALKQFSQGRYCTAHPPGGEGVRTGGLQPGIPLFQCFQQGFVSFRTRDFFQCQQCRSGHSRDVQQGG